LAQLSAHSSCPDACCGGATWIKGELTVEKTLPVVSGKPLEKSSAANPGIVGGATGLPLKKPSRVALQDLGQFRFTLKPLMILPQCLLSTLQSSHSVVGLRQCGLLQNPQERGQKVATVDSSDVSKRGSIHDLTLRMFSHSGLSGRSGHKETLASARHTSGATLGATGRGLRLMGRMHAPSARKLQTLSRNGSRSGNEEVFWYCTLNSK
jgi:hypothetical protein